MWNTPSAFINHIVFLMYWYGKFYYFIIAIVVHNIWRTCSGFTSLILGIGHFFLLILCSLDRCMDYSRASQRAGFGLHFFLLLFLSNVIDFCSTFVISPLLLILLFALLFLTWKLGSLIWDYFPLNIASSAITLPLSTAFIASQDTTSTHKNELYVHIPAMNK